MAEIELTQGKVAIVDDNMLPELSVHKWCFSGVGYAKRREHGTGRTIFMHRQIMGFPEGKEIDHINMDRLDNRLTNLRVTNRSGNSRNRVMKGFETVKHAKGYAVRIKVDGVRHYVGRFETIELAHQAREDKLKELGITHGGQLRRN